MRYLRRIALPRDSVAGSIIEERLPATDAGDAVRPSLVLWACDAANGDRTDAMPVAAAFDLFDRFLLLHEELTGDATATVARWGLGQSLNAGDALYALAFRTLAGDVVHPARRLQAAKLVGEAVLEAIELRDQPARVASFTGAALAAGALVAGASPPLWNRFAEAGRFLHADAEHAISLLRPLVAPSFLSVFEEVARYVARRNGE